MNSSKKSILNSNFTYLAAFVLPVIMMMALYYTRGIFPWGNECYLRSDMYHQYAPFFSELWHKIRNGESLTYSWNIGMGTNFTSLFAYYLASPSNWFVALFPQKYTIEIMNAFIILKIAGSSLSLTYYLTKHNNNKHVIAAIFGMFYGMSGFIAAYSWNIMWLDGMIMLPLIVLGIERIFNNGDIKLYTISMILLFFANYYMGYMSCIFAVIYFVAYFIISYKNDGKLNPNAKFEKKYSTKALMNNTFINRGIKFALGSVIAAMFCAITLIPVFMILKNSSATSGTFPDTFTSYFDILDFITSHFAILETTIRSSGDNVLPNVYPGILTLILLPLFLLNNKISLKEKATYVLLMVFFIFSFNNNCANYIWHAFHFPNDLPYRFSYMYSFIVAVMGYKTLINFKAINIKDIVYSGLGVIAIVILTQKFLTNKMTNSTIYATIILVALWCGYLLIVKNKNVQKRLTAFVLIVFLVGETVISAVTGIPLNQENGNYKENFSTYNDAIKYIDSNDKDFYRTELCYLNTRMDPSYYGYNGISVFSSMAYESYSELQHSLGMFGNRINSYTYNPQTPVYNMMFNIKYLIQTDVSLAPSSNLYKKKYTTKNKQANVYENKYNLPIAYCVNSNIEDWITDEGNPFEIQSDFIKLATGYSNVFKKVDYISTDFDSVTGDDVTENGTYWLNKSDASSTYGKETITLSPTIDGNLYLYVKSSDLKSITVNSEKVSDITQNTDEEYILDLGFHNKGDEVKVSLDVGTMESESTSFDIYCYSCDDSVLKNAYNSLSKNTLKVSSYSDTSIKGTISSKENCYLYSSIPYDDGWSVYVDGKKAETFEIGGTLLAIELTAGNHQIEYKYTPSGFVYGIAVTAITAFGLCGYYIFSKSSLKLNKRARKKEKNIVE